MNLDGIESLLHKIKRNNILTYVAFNLRFDPLLHYLHEHLKSEIVYEASIYCGSYLPNWRPSLDYKTIYSANHDMGGGVHLDLIHEIDYSTWLFGFPNKSYVVKRKISDLEISSYDYANYLWEYSNKTVSITLNYYRLEPKRFLEIVTRNGVIYADILARKIWNDKDVVLFKTDKGMSDTYLDQMKYFLDLLVKNKKTFNSLEDSFKNLKLCLS
jgi:predicted dehydrogenase